MRQRNPPAGLAGVGHWRLSEIEGEGHGNSHKKPLYIMHYSSILIYLVRDNNIPEEINNTMVTIRLWHCSDTWIRVNRSSDENNQYPTAFELGPAVVPFPVSSLIGARSNLKYFDIRHQNQIQLYLLRLYSESFVCIYREVEGSGKARQTSSFSSPRGAVQFPTRQREPGAIRSPDTPSCVPLLFLRLAPCDVDGPPGTGRGRRCSAV
jgi:hypothetical protein